jgi:hypothetical protein
MSAPIGSRKLSTQQRYLLAAASRAPAGPATPGVTATFPDATPDQEVKG